MQRSSITCVLATFAAAFLGGCAQSPEAKETGYLSDYSNLQKVDDSRLRYASPALKEYTGYIIDPVEFRLPPDKLSAEDRQDVAAHFRQRLAQVFQKRGLAVTETPGTGVARVRLAMTGVADAAWWKKVHPVSRMTGAGTGGAAMEGEVVDSVTGKQLGAVVQASPGNQFNFVAFSTVADVKAATDKWAEQAGQRLDEMRATP